MASRDRPLPPLPAPSFAFVASLSPSLSPFFFLSLLIHCSPRRAVLLHSHGANALSLSLSVSFPHAAARDGETKIVTRMRSARSCEKRLYSPRVIPPGVNEDRCISSMRAIYRFPIDVGSPGIPPRLDLVESEIQFPGGEDRSLPWELFDVICRDRGLISVNVQINWVNRSLREGI